jgi:hypothetical protein
LQKIEEQRQEINEEDESIFKYTEKGNTNVNLAVQHEVKIKKLYCEAELARLLVINDDS